MYRYGLGLNKYPSPALLKGRQLWPNLPPSFVCVFGRPWPFSVSFPSLFVFPRPARSSSYRHTSLLSADPCVPSPPCQPNPRVRSSRRRTLTAVGITTHVHRPSSPPRASSLLERCPGLFLFCAPLNSRARGLPIRLSLRISSSWA